jgi:hypothetical protein
MREPTAGDFDMRVLRCLAFAMAIAAPFAAAAAERRASGEALAAARELFTVTFDRAGAELNAQAVEHTWPSLENALRARNPMLDAATLAGLRREFERIRLEKLRELMKDVPAIYARHLGEQEMRQIIEFYRTPAGTRLMHIVPSVMSEIFAIALPAMPGLISDTHEEFLKLARERGYIK